MISIQRNTRKITISMKMYQQGKKKKFMKNQHKILKSQIKEKLSKN